MVECVVHVCMCVVRVHVDHMHMHGVSIGRCEVLEEERNELLEQIESLEKDCREQAGIIEALTENLRERDQPRVAASVADAVAGEQQTSVHTSIAGARGDVHVQLQLQEAQERLEHEVSRRAVVEAQYALAQRQLEDARALALRKTEEAEEKQREVTYVVIYCIHTS